MFDPVDRMIRRKGFQFPFARWQQLGDKFSKTRFKIGVLTSGAGKNKSSFFEIFFHQFGLGGSERESPWTGDEEYGSLQQCIHSS